MRYSTAVAGGLLAVSALTSPVPAASERDLQSREPGDKPLPPLPIEMPGGGHRPSGHKKHYKRDEADVILQSREPGKPSVNWDPLGPPPRYPDVFEEKDKNHKHH